MPSLCVIGRTQMLYFLRCTIPSESLHAGSTVEPVWFAASLLQDQQMVADPNPDLEGEEKDQWRTVSAAGAIDRCFRTSG